MSDEFVRHPMGSRQVHEVLLLLQSVHQAWSFLLLSVFEKTLANKPQAHWMIAVSRSGSKFASRGIYQQDFDQIMTKDFLRDLMVSTEICDNQEFEVIYEKAHEQFEKEIELIKILDTRPCLF